MTTLDEYLSSRNDIYQQLMEQLEEVQTKLTDNEYKLLSEKISKARAEHKNCTVYKCKVTKIHISIDPSGHPVVGLICLPKLIQMSSSRYDEIKVDLIKYGTCFIEEVEDFPLFRGNSINIIQSGVMAITEIIPIR